VAVADLVARALAAAEPFGSFGGTAAWSVRVNLASERPADQVVVYDRPGTADGATKAHGACRILARGRAYPDAVAKLEAAVAVLAEQPLSGWLAWAHTGVEDAGPVDGDNCAHVQTEVTLYRLADQVAVHRLDRVPTALSYAYTRTEVATAQPALVVTDAGSQESYRGGVVSRAPVTVYTPLIGGLVPGHRAEVVYDGAVVEIENIVRRGLGDGRKALMMTGTRREAA
jgi:hypothetical protein